MRRRRATGTAALLAVALTALLTASLLVAGGAAGANLRVRGNQLVDGPGRGHAAQLRGITPLGAGVRLHSGLGVLRRAGRPE